jgi:hypothetical protein
MTAATTTKPKPLSPAEQLERQRRLDRYNELRRQSFPAACEKHLHGVNLPEHVGLSAELSTLIAAHHAEVGQIREQITASLKAMADAIEGAETSGDFTTIDNAIYSSRIDRGVVIQRITRAWATAVDLAGKVTAELTANISPAEAAEANVRALVMKELEAIGLTWQTMNAAKTSQKSAEIQFEQIVVRVPRVAAARTAADTARCDARGMAEQAFRFRAGLEAAKEFMRKTAAALAGE